MPVVESVQANLDGSGHPYLVQGWDDGGTTVVRDGRVFMITKGSVPIDGWNRNRDDMFLALDIDGDGKQEVVVWDNKDGWTGVWKWQGNPPKLHTIWASPSPLTGPGGTWVRRDGDSFAGITYNGRPAANITAIGGASGILAWEGGKAQLDRLTRVWPLGFHQVDALAGGTDVDMTTDVTIFQDGRMHVNTHAHEWTDLHGAHVAVIVLIYDQNGQQVQLFPSTTEPPMRYGVDGSWIGNSEAYGSRDFTIDKDVLGRLNKGWVAIKQYPSPNSAWDDIKSWLGDAKTVAGDVKSIVQSVGSIGGG